MSHSEPQWRSEGQFLVALLDNNLANAKALLCGAEGPTIDPDVRIRVGGEHKPAICIAVERDLVQMADLLLRHNCSVNQRTSSGVSALHLAVARRNVPMVRLLLKNRADVHCADRNGLSPLHVAASHFEPDPEILRSLIADGRSLERCDRNGNTPLFAACYADNVDAARYLVERGAEVNRVNDTGDTPLHVACCSKNPSLTLVEALLNAGARVNTRNRFGLTPLAYLVTVCGSTKVVTDIVEVIVSRGPDLELRFGPTRETLLHLAVQTGASNARILIAHGCDPTAADALGRTPMEYALVLDRPLLLWMLKVCPTQGPTWKCLRDVLAFHQYLRDSLGRSIEAELRSVPRLSRACRYALRKRYGCRADATILQLELPERLRDFLMLTVI